MCVPSHLTLMPECRSKTSSPNCARRHDILRLSYLTYVFYCYKNIQAMYKGKLILKS